MPINLVSQPLLFCGNAKSHPIEWQVFTEDHIEQQGQQASFDISISQSGGVNGAEFMIMGKTFTFDDSQPFTKDSFDYNGTNEQAATNLMNMLKANEIFNRWTIGISYNSSNVYKVSAFAIDYKQPENFLFNYNNVVPFWSAHNQSNGVNTILRNYRIGYQLWESGLPVGEPRYANVPHNPADYFLSTKFNLRERISSLLSTTFSEWSQSAPVLDVNFSKDFTLKYWGVTTNEDGESEPGEVYETSPIKAVNAVFQLRETRKFLNHCPDGIFRVKWLTDRPQDLPIPFDCFEWASIWVENNSIYQVTTNGFKVVYVFDYGGGVTQTLEQIFSGYGATSIPVGSGNPSIVPYMGDCKSYTVTVYGQALDEEDNLYWRQYSEILTRHVRNMCYEEEIYFLEDKGSFGTIGFKELDSIQLLQEGIVIETPLDYTSSIKDIYPEGGKTNVIRSANKKCILISNKLRKCDDVINYFEECLRSPIHYIRATRMGVSDGVQGRRRIIVDRDNSQLYKKGEVTRIILSYQHTTDINLQ